MRLKMVLIALFTLVMAKTYAQVNTESVVSDSPDPSKKEISDDPNIQWRKISIKELMAVQYIEDLITNPQKEKFEIYSFKVTFDGDNVPYFEYDVKGNEFSEAVLGNISKCEEGTKIMIEFIKVTMAGGDQRLLDPVNLLIIE